MRRMFALTGTVFLLRCFTMLITSLSVPGVHLQCAPKVRLITDRSYFRLNASGSFETIMIDTNQLFNYSSALIRRTIST